MEIAYYRRAIISKLKTKPNRKLINRIFFAWQIVFGLMAFRIEKVLGHVTQILSFLDWQFLCAYKTVQVYLGPQHSQMEKNKKKTMNTFRRIDDEIKTIGWKSFDFAKL